MGSLLVEEAIAQSRSGNRGFLLPLDVDECLIGYELQVVRLNFDLHDQIVVGHDRRSEQVSPRLDELAAEFSSLAERVRPPELASEIVEVAPAGIVHRSPRPVPA